MVQPWIKPPSDDLHATTRLERDTVEQLRELARVDLELARYARLEAIQTVEAAKRREMALVDEVDRLQLQLDTAKRREAAVEQIRHRQPERVWEAPRKAIGRDLMRSLQQLAACGLAGAVMAGIVFGHAHWGFDPRYAGVAVGLAFGSTVWAVRGL